MVLIRYHFFRHVSSWGWRRFWWRAFCGRGRGARALGRRRMEGGCRRRWGVKVARCWGGSIRRAFAALAESVIVCRFFYKDRTTIIW